MEIIEEVRKKVRGNKRMKQIFALTSKERLLKMERIKKQIIFFVVFFVVLSSLSYLFIYIDTDGDDISDISEISAGTDWNNPCDPDPFCVMCSVAVSPLEPEKEPSLLFYGFCIALVGAGVVFLIYRLRKRALEEGKEEGIEEEGTEGEVYWE